MEENRNTFITRDDWEELSNNVSLLTDKTVALNDSVSAIENIIYDNSESSSETTRGKRSKIITEEKTRNAIMRVKEWDTTFTGDIHQAPSLYFAQQLGGKLRRLEIELNNGSCSIDGEDFQSSNGSIEFGKLPMDMGSMLTGMVRKGNNESFFQPTLHGTGTVQMKSSLKFLQIIRIAKPTKVVLEKGLYLASVSDNPNKEFKFGAEINTKASSLLWSKKNAIQVRLMGQGLIALELPVHPDELERHRVTPESPYKVNGDYVLYQVGNLKRTYEKSSSLFGSVATGTGFVEVYRGNGEVVTAPTLGYYGAIVESLEGKEMVTSAQETLSDSSYGKKKTGFLGRLFGG